MKTMSLNIDVQDLMVETKIFGEILKNNQPISKCRLSKIRGTSEGAPLLYNADVKLISEKIYTYSIDEIVNSKVDSSLDVIDNSSNTLFVYNLNQFRDSESSLNKVLSYKIEDLKEKVFRYSISDFNSKTFNYSIKDLKGVSFSYSISELSLKRFVYSLSDLILKQFKYSINDLISKQFKYSINELSDTDCSIELSYPLSLFKSKKLKKVVDTVEVKAQNISNLEISSVTKSINNTAEPSVDDELDNDVVPLLDEEFYNSASSDSTAEFNESSDTEDIADSLGTKVEPSTSSIKGVSDEVSDLLETSVKDNKDLTKKVEADSNIDVLPKEIIPKDIVEFLRMYPSKSDVSEVEKYFSKKEISLALRMGKIIKRKNKYRI